MLRLLGRYCFKQETQATLVLLEQTMLSSENNTGGDVASLLNGGGFNGWSEYHKALYKDGIAAMEWCLEKNKYFHRASTMSVGLLVLLGIGK